MQLSIIETEDGIKNIILKGRMDIGGTESIENRFTAAIASESAHIIVDLSAVEFMASIGIGVIVRAVNALRLRQGKIVLLSPQPGVESALQKTMIHTVVPIVHDKDSAIAQFKN